MKIFGRTSYLIVLVLIILSCKSNREFDSEIWNHKPVDWWTSDIRESMLKDLIKSDTLIGKSKSAIVSLLGKPDEDNQMYMKFFVREKYTHNIDPVYIKYLVVKLDSKSKAIECEVVK